MRHSVGGGGSVFFAICMVHAILRDIAPLEKSQNVDITNLFSKYILMFLSSKYEDLFLFSYE